MIFLAPGNTWYLGLQGIHRVIGFGRIHRVLGFGRIHHVLDSGCARDTVPWVKCIVSSAPGIHDILGSGEINDILGSGRYIVPLASEGYIVSLASEGSYIVSLTPEILVIQCHGSNVMYPRLRGIQGADDKLGQFLVLGI
jgi:hypothetical protein